MTLDRTTREKLLALGYRIIDATNQHVASGWVAYPPGNPTYVGITATEDDAWQWATEHAALNTTGGSNDR